MRKIKDYIMVAVKGACMGAADVIPGVSGGTIAFITGIYDEFISSIASVNSEAARLLFTGRFKEFWKHINGSFLLSIIAGIGVSVISLAELMQMLLKDFPIQTWGFFFGLIAASSIFILKGISGWKVREGLFLIFGIILGVVICTLSPTQTPDGLWFIFISGAIAICAMVLPGISGSFILLILGKYQYIMESITGCTGNIAALWGGSGADAGTFWTSACILVVFLAGAVVGIISFSKFLHWLLARWNKETMIILAGFIIGSLVKVWPWSNTQAIVYSQFPEAAALAGSGAPQEMIDATVARLAPMTDMHIAGAILFAVLGFCLVTGIEVAGKLIGKKK